MMHPALSFWLGIAWQVLEQFADGVAWCVRRAYEIGRLVIDVRRRRRRAQLDRLLPLTARWLVADGRRESDRTIVRRMLRMNGLERDL